MPELALFFPALGGGLTNTSSVELGPLDTVTGFPGLPTELCAERDIALANSASRSASELVRRRELLRLGAITLLPLRSNGYKIPVLEIAPSSDARK